MARQPAFHATTILGLRHKGKVVIAGDGQVSLGPTMVKARARKVRTMHKGAVLAGFAGAAADAFTLFEKFEKQLDAVHGKLGRAAIELAKEWRTDRYLRRLEAQLVVLDAENSYLISGTGDVIEPDDHVLGIGSGGTYAVAAARALMQFSDLDARQIAEEAMKIAAGICIYTNEHLTVEELS